MSDCMSREQHGPSPLPVFHPLPVAPSEPGQRSFLLAETIPFVPAATERLGETEPARCLLAIRRLADAVSARLLRFDPASRTVLSLAESADRRLDDISAELVADLTVASLHSAAARRPVWTVADGASVLVRLDERSDRSRWLLLGFGRLSAAARDRVEETAPHYAAVMLSVLGLLDEREREDDRRQAMAAVLDCHECGIVALRHDQTILFKNSAAADILGEGAILQTQRGSLRPAAYHDAVRFQTALDCVIADARARPQPARSTGMIMLLRGQGQAERGVIAVLTPAGARADGPEDAGAAVVLYLMRPDQSAARGLEPICQLHGLSQVETRLVTHLVAGLTVTDAAAEMRIKPDTARTYLKQVFAKTGTHRQSSLVRIMTRYQRAVRGDFDFRIA